MTQFLTLVFILFLILPATGIVVILILDDSKSKYKNNQHKYVNVQKNKSRHKYANVQKNKSQYKYDELESKLMQDVYKQLGNNIKWAKDNPDCSFEFHNSKNNIHVNVSNGKYKGSITEAELNDQINNFLLGDIKMHTVANTPPKVQPQYRVYVIDPEVHTVDKNNRVYTTRKKTVCEDVIVANTPPKVPLQYRKYIIDNTPTKPSQKKIDIDFNTIDWDNPPKDIDWNKVHIPKSENPIDYDTVPPMVQQLVVRDFIAYNDMRERSGQKKMKFKDFAQCNYNFIQTRKITSTLRTKILERDNYTCQKCGAKGPGAGGIAELEVDHKRPLNLGGTNNEDNLWTLCRECNNGKRDKFCF